MTLKLQIAGRGHKEVDHGVTYFTWPVYNVLQPGVAREVFAVAEGRTEEKAKARAAFIVSACDGGKP